MSRFKKKKQNKSIYLVAPSKTKAGKFLENCYRIYGTGSNDRPCSNDKRIFLLEQRPGPQCQRPRNFLVPRITLIKIRVRHE